MFPHTSQGPGKARWRQKPPHRGRVWEKGPAECRAGRWATSWPSCPQLTQHRGLRPWGAWAPVTPHMPPTDSEKLSSVTDGRGVRAALSTQRAEDSSESREEEQVVSRAWGRMCVCSVHETQGHSCAGGLRNLQAVWMEARAQHQARLQHGAGPRHRPPGLGWPGPWVCMASRLRGFEACEGISGNRGAGGVGGLCDPFLPSHFSALTLVPFLPQPEGRAPDMLFPGGAGRPLSLNLTHQAPPWREEVSSAGPARRGEGQAGALPEVSPPRTPSTRGR